MTHSSSFVRKVAYIVAMALLLIPIAVMSLPATVRRDAEDRFDRQPGGVLAEMRHGAGLSQAQLGEIDPASETMKLATFGMRGVAVVLLWDRANEFKKEDWDNLSASLEQIARLQPNFIAVWEHQAHNLSYNVSVEFDDYRQRYHWVKKGIDYLIDGTEFNRNEPRLLWFTGWVVGHKLGRADERVQFRRLYREDEAFHKMFENHDIPVLSMALGADKKPDNWLSGRLWYERAIQAHANGGSIGGKSPVLFFSSPTMSLVNYAGDLQKEPGFDEAFLKLTWAKAHEEWLKLGDRPLASSLGVNIELNDVESLQQQIKDKGAELDALLPGVREAVREKKKAALSTELRRALEKEPETLAPGTLPDEADMTARNLHNQARSTIEPQFLEIAEAAPTDKVVEARRLVNLLLALQQRLQLTSTTRHIVNFEFWRDHSQVGATETNISARKRLFEAQQLYAKPDLEGAKAKFEQSFKHWAEIFEKWPSQREDADNDSLVAAVEDYIKVLEQLDLRDADGGILPADFPLTELMRSNNKENLLKFRKEEQPKDEGKPDVPNPQDEKKKPSEDTPAEEKPGDAKGADGNDNSGDQKEGAEDELGQAR